MCVLQCEYEFLIKFGDPITKLFKNLECLTSVCVVGNWVEATVSLNRNCLIFFAGFFSEVGQELTTEEIQQ